jgi:L-fuconolactonase
MPEFPVVDCHVHFYDPSRNDYPWLATVPPVSGTYLPREFDKACGTVSVDRLVFGEVDAAEGQAFDEAVFLAGLDGTDGRIGGIDASPPSEPPLQTSNAFPNETSAPNLTAFGAADPRAAP